MTPRTRGGTQMIAFRAGDLLPHLEARSDDEAAVGAVAKRDLGRYYVVLGDLLSRIALSEADAMLVMDALSPQLSPRMIWAEVADAIRLHGLAAEWDVVGQALVTRLRDLPLAECYALADAAERFWLESERDAGELLREIGLVRDHAAPTAHSA